MDKHILHNIVHRDANNSSKDCAVCNGSISMDDKKALMGKANEILDRKQQMGMIYNEDEQELIDFAELTSKARNNLDDSSFAYIDSKGGKHLPIPDASHVRNALARFNQTHFESEEAKQKAKAKIDAAAKKFNVDAEDNKKDNDNDAEDKAEQKNNEPSLVTSVDLFSFAEKNKLPTRIKILPYGTIKSPVYGNVVLNKQVMQEMIKHFEEDLRASSSKIGLPIDVEHGETDLKDAAAGWIKKLFAENDGGYAEVDWTPLGQRKLSDKEYKLISPAFYLKGFKHPETGKEYQNVLTGAALVNKPGMPASLPPIINSEPDKNTPLTAEKQSSTVFIELTNSLPNTHMNLKEIIAKEKSTRTSEEQKFLVDHKEELSFAEAKAEGFGMDFKEIKAEEPKVAAGQVLMSEQEVKEFRELQAKMKRQESIAKVKELTFVEKGIKVAADQVEKLADIRLGLTGDALKNFDETLASLPVKEIFEEKGSEKAINMSENPGEQLVTLAKAKQAEAKKNGIEMSYAEAEDAVGKENPALQQAAYARI